MVRIIVHEITAATLNDLVADDRKDVIGSIVIYETYIHLVYIFK